MAAQIELGDLHVAVVRKAIRNLHLSVHPPQGQVRITAPPEMKLDTIRVYVISKLAWIKDQQRKLQAQERETPRHYMERESHYLWGRRYLLRRTEVDAAPSVMAKRSTLVLQVRRGTAPERCQQILEAWYREQLRQALPALLAKWQPVMGVQVNRVFVQRMKTRWGSCNPGSGAIRLNTELARKPAECLEYIVVHEMTHLLEPTHNARFATLMSTWLPHWQHLRQALNRLPVRHEDWGY